jgi:hypothetical protein
MLILTGCVSTPEIEVGEILIVIEPKRTAEIDID